MLIGFYSRTLRRLENPITDDLVRQAAGSALLRPSKRWRREMIYFVQSFMGEIKIGYSSKAEARVHELQVGNGWKLFLLGTIPGTRADEKALHVRFAHLRSHFVGGRLYSSVESIERFDLEVKKRRCQAALRAAGF